MLSPEYLVLFNAVTDAIEILKAAQIAAEELILSVPEPNIVLLQDK